jgi:UDP-glucose 4-epimerase
MKYVVTGGAGFIGSHLVDELVRQGHDVTIIDNLLSGHHVNPGARLVKGDVRNLDGIASFCQGADGIFHLAAIARTPWCIDDPILAYETNVMGTLNVLEAARRLDIKRVVLSSSNVEGSASTPYRTSKAALESLADMYADLYGISTVSLRYASVYGTRQSELGPSPNVFAAFRKSKRESGHVVIFGDGEQTRDFTHVSDVVRGNILAMNDEKCGGVLDICTGHTTSLNDASSHFKCDVWHEPERIGDVKHATQDPTDARLKLGFVAAIRIDEGIHDVL